VRSLEKVAEEAEEENKGWTIKLTIFVGGTCGSVHTQTFNNNLKELGVVESKRNSIRKGLVHELLNAQDLFVVSARTNKRHHHRSFAHTLRRDQESGDGVELETWKKLFKGWTVSFEGWNETARWTERFLWHFCR
jgi:hypothetical protein